MTKHKPAIGDLYDDADSRMNRRVKVVELFDPRGKQVDPYCVVENVGGSRPMGNDSGFLSPKGKRSTMRQSNLIARFKYVEPEA